MSCGGSHAEMFKFSAGQNFFEKGFQGPVGPAGVALMRGTCCAARSKLNIQKSLWPASAAKKTARQSMFGEPSTEGEGRHSYYRDAT